MGAGLCMEPGDIAFKSNFAILDGGSGVVLSRRADRRFEEEGPLLCAALDGAPPCPGAYSRGFRSKHYYCPVLRGGGPPSMRRI